VPAAGEHRSAGGIGAGNIVPGVAQAFSLAWTLALVEQDVRCGVPDWYEPSSNGAMTSPEVSDAAVPYPYVPVVIATLLTLSATYHGTQPGCTSG